MMPAPQVPNESQWYYAAELRKMLDILRNENRNVKESKELKTNSERIAEIKRFVSPFPTLDEAQAKFGAEIKGRHVPRDRAALLPPPPQEPESLYLRPPCRPFLALLPWFGLLFSASQVVAGGKARRCAAVSG